MRPAASRSSGKTDDALGRRIERDIIAVLLGLMALAALWWAGRWWWRAGHAEAATEAAPPARGTAVPPSPPGFDRRRTVARMLADIRASGDAGAVAASAEPDRPTPSLEPLYGLEQGHGSGSWSVGGVGERRDFEPRYLLDGGALAEPPSVAAEAPGSFH